jgi:nitrite reductase (NADH) large subunit
MRAPAPKESPVHYVIIGNSAAGISAAREIRRNDPAGRITMVSDEPTFGYSRVLLPLYIAGKIRPRGMLITPRSFYASHGIRLLRKETVLSIDPKNQRIHTGSGMNLPYDRLLISTGSSPRRLRLPGEELPGIHYLRKLTDAEGIRADLSSTREPAVVVGGGLVSVKTLEALIARKRKAHLVISSSRVLSQMLDQAASDLLRAAFERHGLSVHFNTDVKAFQGREHLESVQLSDGTTLACRIAIIGKGVVPNTSPLRDTGVALQEGVIVDSHMATNIPFIYAAGDVAEGLDLLRGKHQGNAIWPLAMEGGRVAGSNMAGVPSLFAGGLRMNVIEVLGVRVVSVGDWEGEEEIQSGRREIYRKLAFSGRKLKGFILAGDIGGAGILTSLVKNQTNVNSADLEEGLDRGFSYRPRLRVLSGTVQSLEIGRRPT